jgi:hypothetical protein
VETAVIKYRKYEELAEFRTKSITNAECRDRTREREREKEYRNGAEFVWLVLAKFGRWLLFRVLRKSREACRGLRQRKRDTEWTGLAKLSGESEERSGVCADH